VLQSMMILYNKVMMQKSGGHLVCRIQASMQSDFNAVRLRKKVVNMFKVLDSLVCFSLAFYVIIFLCKK
jgi:hypothetical protein